MFKKVVSSIFGTSNDRVVKQYLKIAEQINSYESDLQSLTDDQLKEKTGEFREKIKQGESLDNILPEAFAVVREASVRTIGLRHFDVQLVGGIALHNGKISEMKTGEGKTLVATLPTYLNALTGKGVHVITVNDYLAQRDSESMGKIFSFLGLSVGCIISGMDDEVRKETYNCDITYGTNNEFAFDYLRDNLKYYQERMVQRPFNYVIVDEVDSILIDEARTPLIISGPTNDNSALYTQVNKLIPSLVEDDYEIDEKSKSVNLTDKGHESVEELLVKHQLIEADTGLYDIENIIIIHHVNQALKAHKTFKRDVDYIVKDKKVMIIDEFTGRIMEGRRYSEGLHQAIEAKEGVAIENENQTLASVTFQNFFRMYPKIAGMTGTAMTEAGEFADIYGLDVLSIPTNVPVARLDEDDEIYLTAEEKYTAIINEIKAANEIGQPILVGTTSIERSEFISSLLKKHKIKHSVLNARYHDQEARIIAQAGSFGAVTIATNMAGRGTDIKLGGNADIMIDEALANAPANKLESIKSDVLVKALENKEKVEAAGGLYVLGTERHEARRIDNQLRGRAGRQGDAGKTKFYISMEDDLMRIFGSEKIKSLLSKLGLKDGESIKHPWISKSIEKAQQKVEGRNYEVRKNLLKFDDVMNEQRKVIYEQRKFIMSADDLTTFAHNIIDESVENVVSTYIPKNALPENWDIESLVKTSTSQFNIHMDDSIVKNDGVTDIEIAHHIMGESKKLLQEKIDKFSAETMLQAMKQVLLITLDALWKDHLHTLDNLRTGIGLRAYAQRDPLNEYKMEAFSLFQAMMQEFSDLSVQRILHLEVAHDVKQMDEASRRTFETRNDPAHVLEKNSGVKIKELTKVVPPEERDPNDPGTWGKLSRNEPCPCGSGKKYKHCHGKF